MPGKGIPGCPARKLAGVHTLEGQFWDHYDGPTTEWAYDDVGRLVEEHPKSGGPSPETLLRYVYAYDAAGNRTAKKTDYDANDGNGFAATATYTNNGYNQLTGVSGTRGNRVNVTGTIPTAWTLTDGDVTVTPNSTPGNAVGAEVRGRFFIARNVELNDSASNQLIASTSATTLAGNSPSSSTVLDVALESNVLWTYSYSANGDLTLMESTVHDSAVQWSYTYSVDGWLTKAVKIVDGETALTEQYLYDPIGRKYLVETTDATGSTERYLVYDGGSIVLELQEVGESPNEYFGLVKEHVRGASLGGGIGGLLYTRDADGSVGYFHYDGQGNVVSVTDAAREEIAYYEYDAWGNILTACGSLANEFAFSTKQASTGTGLIDFGHRHYDPRTGRWTQRDPLGLGRSANLYDYCYGRPVGLIDPSGLRARTAGGAAGEAVAYMGSGAAAGAVAGSVIPGVGTAVGAAIGGAAGGVVWAIRQFGTDADYIEDMSTSEAVGEILFDVCEGALAGYFAVETVGVVTATYAYYTASAAAEPIAAEGGAAVEAAAADAESLAARGSSAPLPPSSLGGGPSNVQAYYGVRNGQRAYVGITNNPVNRQYQHGCRFDVRPIEGAGGFTRNQARAIEQCLIEDNPHFENQINSISPANPIYQDAVEWGRRFLNWLGQGGGG